MIKIPLFLFTLCISFLGATTSALAHSSSRVFIVALPLEYYYLAGGVIVFLTFILMFMLGRLPKFPSQTLCALPKLPLQKYTQFLSFLMLIALIIIGMIGNRDPLGNLLPLSIWTLLWVALPFLCIIFGDIWDYLNPFIPPVRFVRGWLGRTSESHESPSAFLAQLGYLPALIGFCLFGWFELVSLAPEDPLNLANAVMIYGAVIFALACYQGEAWLKQGEFLTVFFTFIGKIAPFWLERDNAPPHSRKLLKFGMFGARLYHMPPLSKTALIFIITVLAVVSFDGLQDTFFWLRLIGVNPLDFQGRSTVTLVNSIGLGLAISASIALILAAVWLSCLIARQDNFWQEAGKIVATFLPIAIAYHIAHYVIALLINGQYVIQTLSDPFGRGWNIFGLPHHFVSLSFLQDFSWQLIIWNFQACVIIAGHVVAIILTCFNSTIAQNTIRNRLAHLPLVILMVFYTILGLWLLSSPTGA